MSTPMLVAYHISHFLGDVIVFCFSCCMWFLLIIEHIIGVFFGGQLPIPRWRADKINPISKKNRKLGVSENRLPIVEICSE